MNRIDSGFGESLPLKAHKELSLIQRSNTAPTRRRKPKSISSGRMNTASMGRSSRPQSSTRQPDATDHRRKSVTSSRDSSKSRTHGHGSKPSSRRTSCTLVDPSRPSRHYRIKSTQSIPTNSRDIDDVLALHFRSCSIFQNPSYQSNNLPGSQAVSGHAGSVTTMSMHAVEVQEQEEIQNDSQTISSGDLPKQSEDTFVTVQKADTIEWMSPSTRRREYEKIDRANNGIRGLMRKALPRCVSGPPPPRFYEKDMSDAGSVRRYRLSLDDGHDEDDEKNAHFSQQQQPRRKVDKAHASKNEKGRKWGCF